MDQSQPSGFSVFFVISSMSYLSGSVIVIYYSTHTRVYIGSTGCHAGGVTRVCVYKMGQPDPLEAKPQAPHHLASTRKVVLSWNTSPNNSIVYVSTLIKFMTTVYLI